MLYARGIKVILAAIICFFDLIKLKITGEHLKLASKLNLKITVLTGLILSLSCCCDSQAIGSNLSKLNSSAAREKSQAAQELARCGSSAEIAVSRLSELLYDQNIGVQSSAAYALRKIDTKTARAALAQAQAAKSSANSK